MKFLKPVLINFLALLLVISIATGQPADGPNQDSKNLNQTEEEAQKEREDLIRSIRENMSLFGEIYRQVSLKYVDRINPDTFIQAGIDGMLSTLDPYTEYVKPQGTEDLKIMSQGKYGGVGLQIGTRGEERVLTVVSPIEGTPGWRLGIRAGDQIHFIDEESTAGFSSSDAAQLLRGIPGEPVVVKIKRAGVDDLLEYTIIREEIEVKDISYAGIIEPGIGYIRLVRFSRQAGDEVRLAIEDLLSQGMESLIFDLRSNPGGLLPEAIAVSENFLHRGDPVVSTRGRSPQMNKEFFSENDPSLPSDIHLIVMVNEGSASASEIVSGAVQDLDRGIVIGRTSFGKGLVQSVLPFKGDRALRMTTAKYYTPSGRLIQKVDYFSDNESLLQSTEDAEEDSLYQTAAGRDVVAHGGIVPDIDVEMNDVGELTISLWRKSVFFDFANAFLGKYKELESWKIGDSEWEEFLTYLDTSNFEFETKTQLRLAELREQSEELELSEHFLSELADLDSIATIEANKLYGIERKDISRRLSLELASVLAGNGGRVKASLEYDIQIHKAIEILKEENIYNSMLISQTSELEE